MPPLYVDSSTMRKIQKIQLRWRSPSPQFAWLNIPHRVETYTIAHSTGLALVVNFYAYNHHFKLDYITSSFRDHFTRLSPLASKQLRTGLQCNFVGLDRSKTILTGISSLPHQLKLAMPPIFLLFVVPHQQEQVHPDKSPACGVVGVQPNLGYVPRTLMIHRLVCLCAGSAGAHVQLLQLASLHEEKDVAGSGLSIFPSWWFLWARRWRAPRSWETSEKQVVWSLHSLDNSNVFICCQRTQAAEQNE